MFVQVIRGTVADEAALWAAMDRWQQDLRPGAEGFLGSTAGVTRDGQAVVVARFADAESARRNSERPEQGAWWAEAEKAFDGPPSFFDSEDVDVVMGGGSNDAGFVQVMVGTGDKGAARAVSADAEAVLRRERPDVIGGLVAWGEGGRFVDVTYFTSEDEARANEAREMSPEAAALFEKFGATMPVDEYLDLSQPRLT